MNRLTLFTFLLLFGLSTQLKAQDGDLFSYMSEYLNSEDISQIDRAKSNVKKGDAMNKEINAEDRKINKFFRKKKKKKKAEKKSVEAKKLRIQQAVYYNSGYSIIFSTYMDKLSACSFYYPEDKSKVDLLVEEAKTKAEEAQKIITGYKRKKSKKDLKKNIKYEILKRELQSAISGYISAIENLIESYTIFIDQEEKRQAEEEENRAWANAESDNTIQSYQAYLNVYNNGKYSTEARSRVRMLRSEMQERGLKDKLEGKLVYRVQIAASRVPLKRSVIARYYRNTRQVKAMQYDDWYKYSVGEFSKYAEAKAFVKKVKVKGAFVVAYVNNKKIDIKRAIRSE